jgi:hypothetical protein
MDSRRGDRLRVTAVRARDEDRRLAARGVAAVGQQSSVRGERGLVDERAFRSWDSRVGVGLVGGPALARPDEHPLLAAVGAHVPDPYAAAALPAREDYRAPVGRERGIGAPVAGRAAGEPADAAAVRAHLVDLEIPEVLAVLEDDPAAVRGELGLGVVDAAGALRQPIESGARGVDPEDLVPGGIGHDALEQDRPAG